MTPRDALNSGFSKSFPKRTTIFREDDIGQEMYIVLQGTVSIYIDCGGKPNKVAEISQGGFFGEMSLLEGLRRTATAVTNCDSILLVINKDNFERVIGANPSVAISIMRGLSARLRKTDSQLKTMAVGQSEAEEIPPVEEALPLPVEEALPLPVEDALPPLEEKPAEKPKEAAVVMAPVVSQTGAGLTLVEDDPFALSGEREGLAPFLFSRDVICPICGHKLRVLAIRYSKLKQKSRTAELRVFYHDFEPMIYEIWVCPSCYCARSCKEFEKVKEIEKHRIAEKTEERKLKYALNFSDLHSIDYALSSYDLAAYCYDSAEISGAQDKVAGFWLRMAWFYDDLNDEAQAKEARETALVKYKAAYVVGTGSEENDHKIEYLIGVLEAAAGNHQEAKEYLFNAARRREGHKVIRDLARDALEELKKAE